MTTGPRIGVLALQGAFREHLRLLTQLGATSVGVRTPEELADVDALVIPGGESTAMSRLAVDLGMLDPVAERIRSGMPAFGTCAGMIMLARGIAGGGAQPLIGGMDIVVRRNAFGRQVHSFEADLEVSAIGQPPMRGIFIRAPWIEESGPSVEILADHGGHPVAARDATRIVAAFHPELTDDRRLHRLFVEGVREAVTEHKEDSVVGSQ